MDVTKRIQQLEKQEAAYSEMQERVGKLTEKCSTLILSDKEKASSKQREDGYINILGQIARHLNTLVKFLSDQV